MTDTTSQNEHGLTPDDGEAAAARIMPGPQRAVIIAATLAGIVLAIYQLFQFRQFGVVLEGRYLYILAGLFLSITFLIYRARPGEKGTAPWYDWLLAAFAAAVAGYFAWTADMSLEQGWEYAAPDNARWASLAFWVLVLEATRRAGGTVLFLIVLVISLYPTFAGWMPNPLNGFQQPFWDTIPFHMISAESSFGIPMKSFGQLVIGFILFGAVLARTGGGAFFNDLAFSLVGQFRGGAAKVAIFASGLMGSMSGSVISNVLSTGAVSIPTMKKTGFSPQTAAATEACASTGGVLMPPIMGATAFIMASFLGLPYVEIALAAAIPSLLYYFGLFTQLDAYAARKGLKGVPRAELPKLGKTLASGWTYLFVFALLIYMMVSLRQETLAPFYATALLLVLNQILPGNRLSLRGASDAIVGTGGALAELTTILLGVGLIVGAFSATGLAGTLVNDLIFMAGNSTLALLVMGAATAFVFGMGMTVTACYVFLAVVLAPALEQVGLNRIAIHLFILYWGMVSYITPPVALGAFTAATLAGANPFKVGMEAMRLGAVIYIIPFFFVLDPALVGQGTASEIVVALVAALLGVWFISGGLQGYVTFCGPLGKSVLGYVMRTMLVFAGLAMAIPGNESLGLTHLGTAITGVVLAARPILVALMRGRRAATA